VLQRSGQLNQGILTLVGAGRKFPCEISFPMATLSQVNSITQINIDILQTVRFLRPSKMGPKKLTQLAMNVYPITPTATLELPSTTDPQVLTLPLPDPTIHGRFTSDHLRVRHQLRIIFHRKWFTKKLEWTDEVEIFHRDVGWETRGEKGVLEMVRGEGDYWPMSDNKLLS